MCVVVQDILCVLLCRIFCQVCAAVCVCCCARYSLRVVVQDILSDFDELSEWRMRSLPTDLHAVQNALLMRVSSRNRRHCWPLLLDPDNQAEMWVKALQVSRNIFTARDVSEEEEDEGGQECGLVDCCRQRGMGRVWAVDQLLQSLEIGIFSGFNRVRSCGV